MPLAPLAADRRAHLQALHDHLTAHITELDQQIEAQAAERPQARRLMTHPGVGPVTALATEVFLGDPARWILLRDQIDYDEFCRRALSPATAP